MQEDERDYSQTVQTHPRLEERRLRHVQGVGRLPVAHARVSLRGAGQLPGVDYFSVPIFEQVYG